MYDRQKKLERSAGNRTQSPESVIIDDSDDDEEGEGEKEITEQSLGVFNEVGYILKFESDICVSLFQSLDACQNCLSFAPLNKRRICESCHTQEMENARTASKTQKIPVLNAYLKSTEKFLQ